jgi:hypothetical protein
MLFLYHALLHREIEYVKANNDLSITGSLREVIVFIGYNKTQQPNIPFSPSITLLLYETDHDHNIVHIHTPGLELVDSDSRPIIIIITII